MSRKVLGAVLSGLLCLTAAGCWDVLEVNRRSTADALFLDLTETGLIRIGGSLPLPGTLLPPYNAEEQQFQKRHFIIYGEGRGLLDAWKELQTHVAMGIFFGRVRAVIISERFARSDVYSLIDFLNRRPEIPGNIDICVTRTDPRALLDIKIANNMIPGNYIATYFQDAYKTSLAIPLKLWQLRSILTNGAADAYLPYIEPSQGQYRLAGEALFSDGTWAGALNIEETQSLALLRGADNGYLTVPLGGDRIVAFSEVGSHTDIEVEKDQDGRLHFVLKVKVRGALRETRPRNPEISMGDAAYYDKRTTAYLTRRFQALLAKMQALKSDPVGFGGQVRIKYPRYWEKIDWHQVYPQASFAVKVDFANRGTGLVR